MAVDRFGYRDLTKEFYGVLGNHNGFDKSICPFPSLTISDIGVPDRLFPLTLDIVLVS